MSKKPGEPHNEKKYSLKPLTTRQALERALKVKPKGQPNGQKKPSKGSK